MSNGTLRICLNAVAIACLLLATGSAAIAQQSFRQFDRKMIATPAELFEALSQLNPTARQPLDAQQRLENLEKAGLKFLSKLSPEEREKAWKFAEKHLRKNGVDAASSKKLMREFGLPPEMQNELAKQLGKLSRRKKKTGADGDEHSDDAVSRLLEQAKEQFRKSQSNNNPNNNPNGSPLPQPNGQPGSQPTPPTSGSPPNAANKNQKRTGSVKPNPADTQKSGNAKGTENSRAGNPRSDSKAARDLPQSKSGNRQQKPGQRRSKTNSKGRTKNDGNELEQLLKQLEKSTGDQNNAARTNRKPGNQPSPTGRKSDLDLEDLIEKLADVDPNSDKGSLARDLISKAFQREKNSKNGGSSRGLADGIASNESIGTRFDRLLVKAVDRTLTSDNTESISKGVGGVLGNLIERFQDKQSKKETANSESRSQQSQNQKRNSNRNQSNSSKSNSNRSQAAKKSDNTSSSKRSANSTQDSSTSITDAIKPGSAKISELIPDLSGINPKHVFAFFAVTGLLLFVGYLLMQTFVGDESEAKRREVIKQVRGTTIRSPKDLVDTVDLFLLAKFGIRSSWWNAKLAQHVLRSGSTELQTQVDELFGDYVRARYMRSDIEIPAHDQQRYKQTLQQLSTLDITPRSNLGSYPQRRAVDSTGALEG